MTDLTVNSFYFISGIVLLAIAVIGQAKLLFLEINPGCFGRMLALILGVISLSLSSTQGIFPSELPQLLSNFLQSFISEAKNIINQ
jgi:hypothetical protein